MQEITTVQAAAMTGGAAIILGGVAGLRHAYGAHPRRAVQAKIESSGQEQKRLTEAASRSRRARRHHMISEPANVRTAAPVAAPEKKEPSLDVGTLEELLAGLFSLRGDLTALAHELEEYRGHEQVAAGGKLIGAA
jgi:hypothetical protein